VKPEEVLRELNDLVATAELEALTALAAALAAAAAHAATRAFEAQERGRSEGDRWLTPAEAAPMLGISVKSLHRRWRKLPFCRPGVTRGFRVSLAGLREYMRAPSHR